MSGQGESDPWLDLGKVAYYHYTMAATDKSQYSTKAGSINPHGWLHVAKYSLRTIYNTEATCGQREGKTDTSHNERASPDEVDSGVLRRRLSQNMQAAPFHDYSI